MNTRTDVQEHFALRQLPFTPEIAIDSRFQHPQYELAAAEIVEIIYRRMSAALIAPAGMGKTVVLRQIIEHLPAARFRVHEINVTSLSKRDFCRELATAVGAKPAGNTGALVRAVKARCRQYADVEALTPVIVLDEAHDMRPEVLGLLRLVTNFDMDSRLVVSFVLSGQPPLANLLRRPELEDVRQRIARYTRLRTLSRPEIGDYIGHRLTVAGAKTDTFDRRAVEAIYECAQGNIRATDRVALEAMCQAASAGDPVVSMNHVIAARQRVTP